MGEEINKDFEKYQKELKEKEKRLKMIVSFDRNDDIEAMLKDLKNKEIEL